MDTIAQLISGATSGQIVAGAFAIVVVIVWLFNFEDTNLFEAALGVAFACAILPFVLLWANLKKLFTSQKPTTTAPQQTPVDPKIRVGQVAEERVRKIMENFLEEEFMLHGSLLVFHKGQSHEFSRELDHLYIGNNAIFLVETKHKIGTVTARADADEWSLESGGTMRNALKQAKKACEVLSEKLELPRELFYPVVAIYSPNGTTILDAPSNVVKGQDVGEYIAMSDLAYRVPVHFDRNEIKVLISNNISFDPEDKEKHISRANYAKVKEHSRKIVETASLT